MGHPALLVQTVCPMNQGVYSELVPHLPADDPLCHHMALVLQMACEAEGVAGRLYATALVEALALHVLRRYKACEDPTRAGPSGFSPAQLQRTLTYIQAHLAEALSLPTLAAVAHTSPTYFARLFKQATGQTPHQYVIQCRIAAAQRLLAETELALSAIGLQVGYADQSHFTALFRRHVATTPRAYRSAIRRA
jgi:AraC family transcriptional regulator